MEKINSIYILGASGHGKVIAEIAELNNIQIEGFIDADRTKEKVLSYRVQHDFPIRGSKLVVAVGDNFVRKNIVNKENEFDYVKLLHPASNISKSAAIGQGTVVMAGVSINAEVQIGQHCIVNTNSSIDHECIISDFVHISPKVALAGNVEVGQGTHIGIGAAVIQGIKIGKWATIGAGAVIIRDVPDYAVVVGSPGKIIKYNQKVNND